jgi:phosphate transport system substrate-binding protein
VSREFNQQEKDIIAQHQIDIKSYKLAIDGIGIIVHPENPVSKINYNELRKIYLGEITDWKELEGDNKDLYSGKIRSFIARKNSSLHDIMKNKILGNGEFGKMNVVCTTSAQLLDEVKNNKLAVGFISMNWVTRFADTLITNIKPLKVAPVDSAGMIGDYVGLHQAYIANQSYPLSYELWIFTRDWGMNVASGFINFLLAYDGQKIILNSGLVPVSQPVRIIQLQ